MSDLSLAPGPVVDYYFRNRLNSQVKNVSYRERPREIISVRLLSGELHRWTRENAGWKLKVSK